MSVRLKAEWATKDHRGRHDWAQAPWWESLLEHVYGPVGTQNLDEELAKYGATHYFDDPTGDEFVDFGNEEDATLFLLRWS